MSELSDFVKTKRKQLDLTQEEFAEKAGVALTVIRKIKQGKENLSLSKVNQMRFLALHITDRYMKNSLTTNFDIMHRTFIGYFLYTLL